MRGAGVRAGGIGEKSRPNCPLDQLPGRDQRILFASYARQLGTHESVTATWTWTSITGEEGRTGNSSRRSLLVFLSTCSCFLALHRIQDDQLPYVPEYHSWQHLARDAR